LGSGSGALELGGWAASSWAKTKAEAGNVKGEGRAEREGESGREIVMNPNLYGGSFVGKEKNYTEGLDLDLFLPAAGET